MISPDPLTTAAVTAIAFLLLIRLLDVWEREPLWLVLSLGLWGAVGAVALAGPLNQLVLNAMAPEEAIVWGPALSAPTVEELSKGIALLVVFFVTRRLGAAAGRAEFHGVIDGLVYGAAIGIGFAFAENNVHFLQYESTSEGVSSLERAEGVFNLSLLGHGIYTACFGAALGAASRLRGRAQQISLGALGLIAAIGLHTLHNGLVSWGLVREFGLEDTAAALSGAPLPASLIHDMQREADTAETVIRLVDFALLGVMLLAVVLCVRWARAILVHELAEERRSGLIDAKTLDVMSRFGGRSRTYLELLRSGRTHELALQRREHRQLAEIAFSRRRVEITEEDPENLARLRREYLAVRGHVPG